ncbi:hypothetical protein TrRE_jg13248 [Triparma retinervis]|uniref:Uncharacterized protein n=1 Tax=Triparma retinervis TaxID=2557542 RepID=A0A9W7L329_9STRA|nr:hypothetical protein TrRE_jg13248 [Triparma retinervis]
MARKISRAVFVVIFLFLERLAARPTITIEYPEDGTILTESKTIPLKLALKRTGSDGGEGEIGRVSKGGMCLCIGVTMGEGEEDWILDSTLAQLFSSQSGGRGRPQDTDCVPVQFEGGGPLTRTDASIGVRTGGWVGVSVGLYEGGEEACEEGTNLVSFSQTVVYVPSDAKAAPEGGEARMMGDNYNYIALNVPVGGGFGWGSVGEAMALRFLERGRKIVLANKVHGGVLRESTREALRETLEGNGERTKGVGGMAVLHALGKDMIDTEGVWGKVNVGIVFSETLKWEREEITELKKFDVLLAGSEWNKRVLVEAGRRVGVELKVGVFSQGIEKSMWGRERGRGLGFVIFSGGKLEPRKGQDILIAAFRKFQERHDDARLVFAWQNYWPETMSGIDSGGLVEGTPSWDANIGALRIVDWLLENGIEEGRATDLGRPSQSELAEILGKSVDVAVFTNRCEGGTNLVAMESIGSGVCTILSGNTGHADVVERVCEGEEGIGCIVLREQTERGDGWWESSVEEVIGKLEEAYGDKEGRREIGRRGRERIWSWGEEIDKVLLILDDEQGGGGGRGEL